MTKILITGINGFVGSNLTEKWKNKHQLYGLDIRQFQQDGVTQVYNWNELYDIQTVDAIVHLAGKAHDTKNKSLAQEYFDINTELTKRIFDYFLKSETKKFIFFSSVKAAVDSMEEDVLTEDVIPKPIGPYGESKIEAEKYLISKLSYAKNLNKEVFILRPSMIYGPGNKGNLNLLYKFVLKRLPWPLGAFDNQRSFCSIDNISYVVEELILRNEIDSGIYNVCDDDVISTNELIRLIAISLNRKPHILNLPKSLMNSLASIGSLLRLPFRKETLQKLTENYIVSNDKIKKALNITDMPRRAEDGLKNTFKSFN